MSDERLRSLERRWNESGSVEDEAAYLLERVRGGDLSHKTLITAAYLHGEGARLALGSQAPEIPREFQDWVDRLPDSDLQLELRVRIVLACIQVVLPHCDGELHEIPETVRRIESWLLSGDIEMIGNSLAGMIAVLGYREYTHPSILPGGETSAGYHLTIAVRSLLEAIRDLERISTSLIYCKYAMNVALRERHVLAKQILVDAIVSHVVPWLLGYGDPLAESEARNDD